MSLVSLFLMLLGQIHVITSIPPAGFLGVVKTSPAVEQIGTFLRVRKEDETSISFIARSNTSYRLLARVLSVKGAGQTGIRVKGDSAAAAGGGSRLMPGALTVQLTEAEIDASSLGMAVASGPRISREGNNSSPDNAIVIRVFVDLPEGVSEADFRFELALDGDLAP
jgi:hypothetical protein